MARDLWGNVNTLFEIGIEILRLMEESKKASGQSDGAAVEKIADGVLLMSNDKEILIAVNKDAASGLSDAARAMGTEKGEYLCYVGAMTAIPLYELSRDNTGVRDYIVSEESLRATLCGNYPEYVKSYNMTAPPEHRITDADAPPYLFLQKQLDNEADSTRSEVSDFQAAHNHENPFERSRFDDVLELER